MIFLGSPLPESQLPFPALYAKLHLSLRGSGLVFLQLKPNPEALF